MIRSFVAPTPLPPEIERRLREELQAGETALWTGQPAPGQMLRRQGLMLICGVVVCLFSLLLEAISAGQHSVFGMLAAGALALLGLWTALQGVRQALRTSQFVYAVTKERVLLIDGSGAVISLTPEQTQARTLRAGRNGSGDLTFACLDQTITVEDRSRVEHNGFLGIADVPAVDALLRQTFGEASHTP